MKHSWFLSGPDFNPPKGRCSNCEAPATGFDSHAVPLCCGKCRSTDGCTCLLRHIQAEVAGCRRDHSDSGKEEDRMNRR